MIPRIRIWLLFSLVILASQGCFAVLLDSDQNNDHEYLSNSSGSAEKVERASLDSDDVLDFDREDDILREATIADSATEDAVVPIQKSVDDSNATSESEAVEQSNAEKQAPSLVKNGTSDEDEARFTGDVSNSILSEAEKERWILTESGLRSGEIPVENSTNAQIGTEQKPTSATPADESEIEGSIVEPKIELSTDYVVESGVDEDDDSVLAPGTNVDGDARSTEQGVLDLASEVDSEIKIKGEIEANVEKGTELDDEPKTASDYDVDGATSAEQTQTTVKESNTTTPDNSTAEESHENHERPAETTPPKPGSLASFFKQVSEKEKERDEVRSSPESDQPEDYKTGKVVEDALRSSSTTIASGSIVGLSLTMQNDADNLEPAREQDTGTVSSIEHRDLTAPSELSRSAENSEEEDRAYGYTAVWGRQTKHTVNKHLYEVAQKNAATGPAQDVDESIHAEDNDGKVASPGTIDSDAESPEAVKAKDPRMPLRKSVNTQFVEGLDDINKFLEEVEPPDELDVGAAGSSLQEVLIGQGAQILLKRVTIILSRVKQSFGATRIKQFFASRRTADGEFALFTRDELERAGKRVWNGCRSAAGKVHEMWEDLFDDDDSQFEAELGHEASKLDSIRNRLLDENRLSASDTRGSERQFAGSTNKGELD
jgi:hypothetical protein